MSYTEEEIKKYLEILHNYKKPIQQGVKKVRCSNCQILNSFMLILVYKICDECGTANGHVLRII